MELLQNYSTLFLFIGTSYNKPGDGLLLMFRANTECATTEPVTPELLEKTILECIMHNKQR